MAIGAASGSLVVSLALDAAQFITGLTKSEYEAKKWAKNMEKVGREAGQLLGLGFTAGATAIFFLTKNAIDAADKLNDLSKKTGVAVETLGGLGFAAKQTGSDLDGVAQAFKKLNVNIAEGAGGKQDIIDAFHAVGVSAKDLKTLAPDQILTKVATAFAGFADGPEKAAIASKLFGKAYQDIIPLLDEGGAKLQQQIDYFKKYGGITAETAQRADEFNDTVVKLELLSGAFARTLASDLLPSLQALANLFVETKEKGSEFQSFAHDTADVIRAIATGFAYASTELLVLGKGFGFAAAQIRAFATEGVSGWRSVGEEADKVIDGILARRDKFIEAIHTTSLTEPGGKYTNDLAPPFKPRAKSLGSSDATDLAKKQFDAQIHDLETFIRRQKELESDAAHYLEANYQDQLISLDAFYSQKADLQARTLQAQLDAYDKEVSAARTFAAKAKPADRIDAETKLADAIAKRQRTAEQGAQAEFDLNRQRQHDIDAYNDSVAELSAQVLALSGHEKEAASITFEIQNRRLRGELALQGNTAGQQALDQLKAQQQAQIAVNDAARAYQSTILDLSVAQARIALEEQAGNITSLDAINKKSDLARQYIATLTAEADAQERAAQALQGAARTDALNNVKRLRLEIDQLAASADELANKFRDIFVGPATDFLTDIVTGTKSVSQAFKDMEKQIVSSIARIAAQNVAQQIFGTGGAGGSIPGFLASLFGSASGGSYFGAGAATLGGFAGGGDPPVGRLSVVGEHGPELFMPKTAGTVIPFPKGGKIGNTTIVINVPQGTSTASASQIAAESARAIQRGRRNL